jgi:hypothetical protein
LSEYEYDYILDKDGTKGVSVKNWLEKNKLTLAIIDVQNYITDKKYREKYRQNGTII